MVQPPPPGGSATLHEEPRGSGRGCAVAVLVSAVLVLVLLGCGGVGLLVWLRGPGGDYAEAPPCALVEESGVLGAAFLIFIYLAILFRACNVSSRYSDMPAMLMTMGLALMITCQALISMLVAVGLGPVTGQPLPLISRGGTSVLITSVYFGIMMGVSREQKALRERVQETIEESQEEAPIVTLDN